MLESLDNVASDLQQFYAKQTDGKYKLDVSGIDDAAQLKRKNQELLAEKAKIAEKLKAYDALEKSPEDLAKLNARMADLEEKERLMTEKKLIESGEIEKLFESRTDKMRRDHENQVKKLTEAQATQQTELEAYRMKLTQITIENGIIAAANEVGTPRPEALQDIIARGMRIFKLDDNGAPVPHDKNGEIIFGSNGAKPLTMAEWAADEHERASFLWLSSSGGGAKGSVTTTDGRTYSSDELAKMTPAQKIDIGRNQRKQ